MKKAILRGASGADKDIGVRVLTGRSRINQRQQCRYGSECITGLAVVLLRDQIVGEAWIKAPEMFE